MQSWFSNKHMQPSTKRKRQGRVKQAQNHVHEADNYKSQSNIYSNTCSSLFPEPYIEVTNKTNCEPNKHYDSWSYIINMNFLQWMKSRKRKKRSTTIRYFWVQKFVTDYNAEWNKCISSHDKNIVISHSKCIILIEWSSKSKSDFSH